VNSITFEYPYLFLLIIIFLSCTKWCELKASSFSLPHIFIYKKLGFFSSKILIFFKWLAIIALITALSSPIKENSYEENESDGYNIALLLDSSGSMRELGFDINTNKNKFTLVQELVSKFVKKRVSDNIAIIVFGEYAYTAAPLTYDKDMINSIIARLSIGIAGEKTAINDAIAQGVKLLKDTKSKNRVMILLTDGMTTAGSVPFEVALKLAKEHKVKIYTIAMGQDGDFDSYSLEKIATQTDAKFFIAKNREILKEIYSKIDKLEKSKIRSSKIVYKTYYYQYPLILGILALIFYIYFRNKKGM